LLSPKWNVPSPSVTPTNHSSNAIFVFFLLTIFLLQNSLRLVSDESEKYLVLQTQADCPHVIDFITAKTKLPLKEATEPLNISDSCIRFNLCKKVRPLTEKWWNTASIQFRTIWFEEFPASSRVFMSTVNTNKTIDKYGILHTVQPVKIKKKYKLFIRKRLLPLFAAIIASLV